ncbi:hypothetical protein [Kordia sp.]|nr:hypothetical protein [Kordia sp.]
MKKQISNLSVLTSKQLTNNKINAVTGGKHKKKGTSVPENG